jgi:hypothetical protein
MSRGNPQARLRNALQRSLRENNRSAERRTRHELLELDARDMAKALVRQYGARAGWHLTRLAHLSIVAPRKYRTETTDAEACKRNGFGVAFGAGEVHEACRVLYAYWGEESPLVLGRVGLILKLEVGAEPNPGDQGELFDGLEPRATNNGAREMREESNK